MNQKTKAILDNNPALRVLAEIDNGGLASELAHELAQLVSAGNMTGKKGELVLRLTVKPKGANKYELNGEVKPKPAKGDRGATTFFADEKLTLQRTDPNQDEIKFPGTAAAN